MIRINLLASRAVPPPRHTSIDRGQRATLAYILIVVATVVVIGWRFWSLRQESNQLLEQLTTAEQEIARLRPAVDRVEELVAERSRLEQYVGLIHALRRSQRGPIHMLDQLSRAIPEGLWLAQLDQDGDEVIVEGRALTLSALSEFVANLERSGYFELPVEIIDSQVEETDQGEVVGFELRADLVLPDA